MSNQQYHPDDKQPVKLHLYLIGLIIFGAVIATFPIGLNMISTHQNDSNAFLLGKIVICLSIAASYALLVMIVHFFSRLHLYHKYGKQK